ncbi:hypothetical protein R1flu_026167 [Riccia fluitans]|uniref:Uncharacterized protein n=1 Tax=Riccia fluitans TaxID=41844 RepID=A0ABD1XF67_9MARC
MSGSDDAAADNPTFHPRNGRAIAEDAPLHRITNCLTMRQWRRLIGLCRPRNEGWFIDQLLFFSSQGHEDGKLLDLRAKLVIRQALKWIGRPSSSYTSTTLVLLALAEVDPGEPNLKPDWYAWVSDQISFRLNHTK